MRAPAFWWRRAGLGAGLLRPAAALYGGIAARRMARPGERAAIPVICVGNFTLGGAGKTPTALALARLLAEAGEAPAFLTRGYGGRLAGPVRVDPDRHGPGEIGDEPLLLARAAPTIVARDRPAGARLCATNRASLVLMDDGLQNPSLEKDAALAVVDAASGNGNGLCFPAGPLRAPLSAQWPEVNALVLVGEGGAGESVAGEARRLGKPVFRARIAPEPQEAAGLRGRRVLAFAGIGRPEKFFRTLEESGAVVARRHAFPDHHVFAREELRRLAAEAARENLLAITTEKDFVRISALGEEAAEGFRALPVTLAFEREEEVLGFVREKIAAVRARGGPRPAGS